MVGDMSTEQNVYGNIDCEKKNYKEQRTTNDADNFSSQGIIVNGSGIDL